MNYAVHLTIKSGNAKVGPIPVSTTSANTCPSACPLKGAGCYANAGPLASLWRSLSAATPGTTYKLARGGNATAHDWRSFTAAIAALPEGALWRHNQAGDLPGEGDAIDHDALASLVEANAGRRGFTYTHKPLTGEHGEFNRAAVAHANRHGFTVNLSADNLREADELSEAKAGPVVVVLPASVQGKADVATPQGRKVVVCPATYREDVSCKTCGLCQKRDRKVIVGFPAHGGSYRKADAIASA
jgi:hypothetical protein